MKEELISVIVPVYNIEQYLDKCIQSILKQTYQNLEIILVDDGSTDNCYELCERYALEDKRVIVIHQENQGLSEARNVGIRHAKGKYIGFVDSDDYISLDMYEKLYKKMIEKNVDISICRFEKINEDGSIYKENGITEFVGDKVYNSPECIYKLLEDKFITNHAWNKLYKKELFEKIEFPKGKKYEDIGTTYKLFYKANSISYTEDTVYYYLQRKGSILHSRSEDLITARIDMIKDRYEYLKDKIENLDLLNADRLSNIYFYHIKSSIYGLEKLYFSDIMQFERNMAKDIVKKYKNIKISLKTKILIRIIYMFPTFLYKLIRNLKEIKFKIKRIKEKYFQSLKIDANKQEKKIFIFLAANYGNLGDVAITCAQKQFIENNLENYKVIEVPSSGVYKYIRDIKKKINKDDIITIIGGGNLGNLYESFEKARRYIIKTFRNNKIISFPQSMYFTEDELGKKSLNKTIKIYNKHKKLTIFAREHVSFEKMKSCFNNNVYLTPDIVFSLKLKLDSPKREFITLCLRDDKEKSVSDEFKKMLKEKIYNTYGNIKTIDTHIGDDKFDYAKKEQYLINLLNKFKSSKLVITDRLHGMIFSVITNTPCIVLQNNNGKITNTYYDWLKNIPNVILAEEESIEQFMNHINQMYNQVIIDNTKDLQNIYYKFDILNKVLKG